MNIETESIDRDMPSQVDRLVCGELDDADRRRLLAWLETDPVRWRLCGVAFLEAQAWSGAMQCWPRATAPSDTLPLAIEPVPAPSRVRRAALVRQAFVATSIVLAFGFGLALGEFYSQGTRMDEAAVINDAAPRTPNRAFAAGSSMSPSRNDSVLASLSVETGDGFGRSTPIQIPVVPAAIEESHEREFDELPEYERQKLERRGFKVSRERRFLFAKLPDGRQVVVPVEQFRVNPIPIHIN